MKKLSKIVSLLLVVLMLAATTVVAVSAVSSETGTVTVTNAVPGEKFDLYRLFDYDDATGAYTVTSDFRGFFTKARVTNAAGDTPTDQEILVYLANITSDTNDAQTLAVALAEYADGKTKQAEDVTVADGATQVDIENVPYGYYLLVPKLATNTGDQIVFSLGKVDNGAVTIRNKLSVPTPDKTVTDSDETRVKSNITKIGEELTFEITTAVPVMDAFDRYRLQIKDTMHNMKYVDGSLKLYVDNAEVDIANDANAEDTDSINVYASIGTYSGDEDEFNGDGTQSFTVHIKDLKRIATAVAGKEIKVEYKAKLTKDAVLGSAGNLNEADLRYSNNPSDGGIGLGESTKTRTKTYTLGLQVDKKNSSGTALPGSEWQLKKGDDVIASDITGDQLSSFNWSALDVGTYTLTETSAPDGYTKMEGAITIVVSASVTEEEDSDGTYKLTSYSATLTAPDGYVISNNSVLTTGITTLAIKNYQPSELPGTGSIGLFIFAGASIAALIGICVVVMVKKKARKA